MVGFVDRLVPGELWEIVQRVVPEAPSRPLRVAAGAGTRTVRCWRRLCAW